MRRSGLEHIIRAASAITGERDIVVIGSAAVLGSFDDAILPPEATRSIEADVAFLDDPDGAKADLVDGALGELSIFHSTFGYYAQGVSLATAKPPAHWLDRLVPFETPMTQPGRALCLDAHDTVLAKLVAGRVKDIEFATALLGAGLLREGILAERLERLEDVDEHDVERIRSWLARDRRRPPGW